MIFTLICKDCGLLCFSHIMGNLNVHWLGKSHNNHTELKYGETEHKPLLVGEDNTD